MQLPRSRDEWKALPLGAIFWFSTTKMLLLPVLGVLIIQGLVKTGFIDADDKVLRFVCMCVSFVHSFPSFMFLFLVVIRNVFY